MAVVFITNFIKKWGKQYYKVGQVIYYKVCQSLLQSSTGIIKSENHYKEGQYTIVTLVRIETHVY